MNESLRAYADMLDAAGKKLEAQRIRDGIKYAEEVHPHFVADHPELSPGEHALGSMIIGAGIIGGK